MDQVHGIKLRYKIPLDVVIAILLVLPSAIINTTATPYQRGFYCDDHSVRYPYKPDTITTTVLVVVGGLIPIISIIICERILFTKYQSIPAGTATDYEYTPLSMSTTLKVNGYFVALYKYIGGFLVGACINQSLTDCAKFLIGRLRPHFLSLCAIDYAKYCPQGYETYIYIENVTCIGDGSVSDSKLKDARLSFPSGHASFAFYAFIFLMVYLHIKMNWYYLLRTLFQAASFTCAFLTALTRVSDYKHHPGDVLGGGLLGTAIALFTTLYICRLKDMHTRLSVIVTNGIMQTLRPQKQQDYGTMEISQTPTQSTTVYIEE